MDGIGSREILKYCLNLGVKYISYEHNVTQLDKKDLNNTLFIDCSPNAKVVNEYMQTCDNLLIADHHQSFIDAIQGLYGDRTLLPEDMKVEGYKNSDDISGVTLAFYILEVIYKDLFDNDIEITTKKKIYSLERYISIADTFCKDNIYEFAVARNFSTYLMDMYGDYMNLIPNIDMISMVEPNSPYDLNKKDKIKKIAEGAVIYRSGITLGNTVALINNIDNVSDVAEYLRENKGINLVIGYMRKYDQYTVSLRSDGTFDCQEFALKHGGGGHKKAAGFTIPLGNPVVDLIKLIYA